MAKYDYEVSHSVGSPVRAAKHQSGLTIYLESVDFFANVTRVDLQLVQASEVFESSVGDLGLSQVKVVEMGQAVERVLSPTSGDRCAPQV